MSTHTNLSVTATPILHKKVKYTPTLGKSDRSGKYAGSIILISFVTLVFCTCSNHTPDTSQKIDDNGSQNKQIENNTMETISSKRVKLRLTAEERIVIRNTSVPDQVISRVVELVMPLNQQVALSLELSEEKHFWFNVSTLDLHKKAPDVDLGDPETNVWIAAEIHNDWSDSFMDVSDLPKAKGVRETSYSPGEKCEILSRHIDAIDVKNRSISQYLSGTITFIGFLSEGE